MSPIFLGSPDIKRRVCLLTRKIYEFSILGKVNNYYHLRIRKHSYEYEEHGFHFITSDLRDGSPVWVGGVWGLRSVGPEDCGAGRLWRRRSVGRRSVGPKECGAGVVQKSK